MNQSALDAREHSNAPRRRLARSRTVTVGVVDSGWDFSVTESRIGEGRSFVLDGQGQVRLGSDVQDVNGHGTLASDIVLQVAQHCEIVPLRIFGGELDATPAQLIAAITWAGDAGIDVLNLSLGTLREDARDSLAEACRATIDKGCVIVAALGGNGRSFPAVFESVIAVQSVANPRRFEISYNPAGAAEIEACGHAQLARGLGGLPQRVSGSSFAAPVAAGRIARVLGSTGARGTAEVRRMLASGEFSLY